MGSFSYIIDTGKIKQNIVAGETIYVSCGDDFIKGEYLDYGRVSYMDNYIDLHCVEGIMIQDKLSFLGAIEKSYQLKEHSSEERLYRNLSIYEFFDMANDNGEFNFIKLSYNTKFDEVENRSDPHQGFHKWKYDMIKKRKIKGSEYLTINELEKY